MTDKRIGLGMVGGLPVRPAVDYVRAAEEAGFSGAWIHETYGLRDAHSYLAAAGLVTSRIKLVAGCLNTYTRNAALTAMICATLQELTAGRFALGLGTAYNRLPDFGYVPRYSISSLRENVEAIRKLLCGEAVTMEGHVVSLKNMKLQVPACDVPVYFATKGPKSLALAAELADGLLDGPKEPPALLRAHLDAVQAHHPRPDFDFAAYVFCSIDDDARAARQAARRDPFFLYLMRMAETKRQFELLGWDLDLHADLARRQAAGDLDGAAELVSDDMLDLFVLAGSRHDVLDGLAAYLDAGVREIILQPLTPSARAFQEAIAAGREYLAATTV